MGILMVIYKIHKYIKFFDAHFVIDHEFCRIIFVGAIGDAINTTSILPIFKALYALYKSNM